VRSPQRPEEKLQLPVAGREENSRKKS
jgi:hypothetical protein